MPRIHDVFLESAGAVRDLLASPSVAECWDHRSALLDLTVGALAGHTARAAIVVESYLDGPPPGAVHPLTAAQYYDRVLDPSHSSPANVGVRQRGAELGRLGQERLVAELGAAVQRLRTRLRTEPEDRELRVAEGIPMRLGDYLVTRIVELTVHADDLAVSAGMPGPVLPPNAIEVSIRIAVDIARIRHGDLAVLRALSRRERQSPDILCVF